MVTITPAYASFLLQRVRNVRKVLLAHVHMLARAMLAGKWERNGSAIKLDHEGYVVDGEHRLRACVEAGVPFETLLIRGIKASATIDTGGRIRTAAQVVGHGSAKNSTTVVAIARIAIVLESDGNLLRLNAGTQRVGISVQQIAEYAEEHMDALVAAAAIAQRVAATTRLPVGPLGFVAFRAVTNPKMGPFMRSLETGEGLSRGNPAYALREKARSVSSLVRIRYEDACHLVFKAWNAYVRGTEIYQLKVGANEPIQTPLE